MTTQEVADKLVQYCREGKNYEAINELYDDNIVSKEMDGVPTPLATGKEAILAKTKEWYESVVEIHGGEVSEPLIAGDFFTVKFDMDITFKEYGRGPMVELAVYQVKDGKIVFEQFFYNMG